MTPPRQMSLYGLDDQEVEALILNLDQPRYRGAQLLNWLYSKHIQKFSEAENLPEAFKKALEENVLLSALEMDENQQSQDKESQKFLFKTKEGSFLESVLISQQGRRTVCVSTQLGCKIGCTFCASGKGKFGRNLTAGEIVEQVVWIERLIKKKITNVVFMGMGEPLDNFEPTMKALRILQAPWGFGIGARKITVSTSGITPKIVEFVKRHEGRVRLSISLHSTSEIKRSELVPVNKRYPLKELVQTLKKLNVSLSRKITFEYTLIKDENDSEEEAQGVVNIAKPLNAMVNIIPYNPIAEMKFQRPSQEKIKAFRTYLVSRGVRVIVRQTAGGDIDAACGQLRLDREKAGK